MMACELLYSRKEYTTSAAQHVKIVSVTAILELSTSVVAVINVCIK